MRKVIEAQRGCWAKAKNDEMLFILLARDKAAPETIRFWVRERIRMRLNQEGEEKIQEALKCAELMEAERTLREAGAWREIGAQAEMVTGAGTCVPCDLKFLLNGNMDPHSGYPICPKCKRLCAKVEQEAAK